MFLPPVGLRDPDQGDGLLGTARMEIRMWQLPGQTAQHSACLWQGWLTCHLGVVCHTDSTDIVAGGCGNFPCTPGSMAVGKTDTSRTNGHTFVGNFFSLVFEVEATSGISNFLLFHSEAPFYSPPLFPVTFLTLGCSYYKENIILLMWQFFFILKFEVFSSGKLAGFLKKWSTI